MAEQTMEYELITLDGRTVEQDENGNYRACFYADLSDRYARAAGSLVRESGLYRENALLQQVINCLKEREKTDPEDSRCLKYRLFFVNFDLVFRRYYALPPKENYSREDLLCGFPEILFPELVRRGFDLKVPGGAVRHFSVFEKSSSMARESRITFVDDSICRSEGDSPSIKERLMLGMEVRRAQLSKLYAYTGLYLTDGYRIRFPSDEILNEKTVIVIDEQLFGHQKKGGHFAYEDSFITAEAEGEEDGMVRWRLRMAGDVPPPATFDGEGLVDPSWRELFNEQIPRRDRGTSFQIRMPFVKGMLHTVDFPGFIRTYIGECTDPDSLCVKDIFGIARKLSDVRMILSGSMFKCRKWLKEYAPGDDPMKYYFSAFHRYGHALYISQTDAVINADDTVRLNYQFLNTLALTGEEQEQLITDYAGRILDLPGDRAGALREMTGGEEEDEELPSWAYALSKDPVFVHDLKVRDMLRSLRRERLFDLAGGRVRVAGLQKYLSHDLLLFMVRFIRCLQTEDDGQTLG